MPWGSRGSNEKPADEAAAEVAEHNANQVGNVVDALRAREQATGNSMFGQAADNVIGGAGRYDSQDEAAAAADRRGQSRGGGGRERS